MRNEKGRSSPCLIGPRNQGFGGSPGWAAFPGKRVGEGITGWDQQVEIWAAQRTRREVRTSSRAGSALA